MPDNEKMSPAVPTNQSRQPASPTTQPKHQPDAEEIKQEVLQQPVLEVTQFEDETDPKPTQSDLQIKALEKVFKTAPKQRYKPKFKTNDLPKTWSYSAHNMRPLSGAQIHLKSAALDEKEPGKKNAVQWNQETEKIPPKKTSKGSLKRKKTKQSTQGEGVVVGDKDSNLAREVWMARGFSPMRKLATLTPTRQFCPHCHQALADQQGEATFGAPILKRTCKGKEYPQCPGTGRDHHVYKPPGEQGQPCELDEATCRAEQEQMVKEQEKIKNSRKSIFKKDGGFLRSVTRFFE